MSLRDHVRAAVYGLKMIPKLTGVVPRDCPCCGFYGYFNAYGMPPRLDVKCGKCGSLERHRLFKLAMDALHLIPHDAQVLHFAPEVSIRKMVREVTLSYVSADIQPGIADIVLNLEQIDQPSNTLDVVIANHVLEHVNDKLAINELYRILKPGGKLIAMVPIVEGWDETYENAAVGTESERDLHFGQGDHVRYFGRDYRARLSEPGFIVGEFGANGADTVKYGLMRGEKVFIGTKPVSN